MKTILFVLIALLSQPGFTSDAMEREEVSAGASTGPNVTSEGASNVASYDAKNTNKDDAVTVTHTVDQFKPPHMETRPRTTFNTGTPTQIDNDVTGINPPNVNQGVVTAPEK